MVGRTPIENADVTFRIGRPDDLWFHVQNQPSAHVILQRDDREAFTAADIEAAAALAAGLGISGAVQWVTRTARARRNRAQRAAKEA